MCDVITLFTDIPNEIIRTVCGVEEVADLRNHVRGWKLHVKHSWNYFDNVLKTFFRMQ